MRARWFAFVLFPGLCGCYTYRLMTSAPEPSSRVSLLLTDVGRVAEANTIGPEALRVEGSVVAATDTAYTLAVSGVQPIRGVFVPWSGETVSVRRAYVAQTYERRLSGARTAVLAGGATGAVLALALTTNLFGFGGSEVPIVPPGGGGGQSQ